MSHRTHRPKHVAEYVALRLCAGGLRALPYRAALGVGWLVAALMHHVLRWRTAEARRRIREVFGDTISDTRVRHIAWIAMRNLAFNAVDSIRLPALTLDLVRARTDHAAIETARDAIKDGRGAIVVIPHAGSWDQAAVAMSLMGLPVFAIVARQKNPLTDEFMNRMRGVTGLETIHRDNNVVRATVRNLKQGKVLAFLTDLRSRTPGVKVRFLGKEANLVMGLGLFARMGDVPVVPAFVTRVGWTRHRWRAFAPIRPDPTLDRETDTLRITQYVMDQFDRAIREEPEQYFWYNKRWVLQPLEQPAAVPAESGPPASSTNGSPPPV